LAENYRWAPGRHISETMIPAQLAGETFDGLQRDNGGRLTARIVVDAARPSAAPLHSAFEWDDARAAELQREWQARHLLSAIRVVRPSSDPQTPTLIHAFVNLEESRGADIERGYIPIARVYAEPDLLRQAIARAAAELRSFENRYAEFEAIVSAVKVARERIEHSYAGPEQSVAGG